MWALATPLRLSRKVATTSFRSVASSLPRQQQLEGLPIQEPITGSSQASIETQVEAQVAPADQAAGEGTAEPLADELASRSPGQAVEPPANAWLKNWQRRKARDQIADMIAEEGSYQTDSNWKPTDALTSPPSAHDVTVSHLMAAGAHLGHHPNLTLNTYQPYLAGRRGGVDIINLSLTLPSLRKACGVVRDISRDDGVIVFMGRKHLTKNPVWKAVKRLPGVGHAVTERWRPGSLTNAASVFGSEYVLNGSYLPDLVVIADPRGMINVIRECNAKNVPTMGIVDTDVDPRIVTFPIYANCESSRSLELLFGALGRAGEEGIASRQGLQAGNQFRVQPGQFQAKIDTKREPDVIAYSEAQDPLWRGMRKIRDSVKRGNDRGSKEGRGGGGRGERRPRE